MDLEKQIHVLSDFERRAWSHVLRRTPGATDSNLAFDWTEFLVLQCDQAERLRRIEQRLLEAANGAGDGH